MEFLPPLLIHQLVSMFLNGCNGGLYFTDSEIMINCFFKIPPGIMVLRGFSVEFCNLGFTIASLKGQSE